MAGDCLQILTQQKLLACLAKVNLKLATSVAYFKNGCESKHVARIFSIDFLLFLLMHASSFLFLFSLFMSQSHLCLRLIMVKKH